MELFCFDLDNTLVNSNKAHISAFKKAFLKFGLEKRTKKEILKYFSYESTVLVKKIYPKLSKKDIKDIVDYHDKIISKEAIKYATPFRGAKPILKKLKKNYKLALTSNCKHNEMLAIMRAVGIDRKLFKAIIGNDDVRKPKPSPNEIKKAMRILKIKKGYMVGDSILDVRAGKRAGLKTIAVATGNHSKKELRKEKPDYLLNSVSEIRKII